MAALDHCNLTWLWREVHGQVRELHHLVYGGQKSGLYFYSPLEIHPRGSTGQGSAAQERAPGRR